MSANQTAIQLPTHHRLPPTNLLQCHPNQFIEFIARTGAPCAPFYRSLFNQFIGMPTQFIPRRMETVIDTQRLEEKMEMTNDECLMTNDGEEGRGSRGEGIAIISPISSIPQSPFLKVAVWRRLLQLPKVPV